MNKLATLATIGLIACANADAKADAKEAAEVVAGLMMGVIQKDNLTNIQNCIQDVETLVPEIKSAVANLKKGGVSNYIKGFEQVVKISEQVPTDLKDCKSITADVAKMESWAVQFKNHPLTMGEKVLKNLVSNFKEVDDNVQSAVSDYDNKSFYKFGEVLGDTMVVLAGPVAYSEEAQLMTEEIVDISLPKLPKLPVVQIKEALSFLGGVANELIKSDKLSNTENCIKDASAIETGVATVISDFKTKTMSGYLSGIQALGELLVKVPTDAAQCEAVKADLPKIQAFVAQFKDPKAEMSNIAKNLWNNFDAFKKFTEQSEAAYDKKDFYNTGINAGRALWIVMEGTMPM